MALFRIVTAIDDQQPYAYLPVRCWGCHGAMHQKQLWCHVILSQQLHPTTALDLAQALPVDSWLTPEQVQLLHRELTAAGATIDIVMAAMQYLSSIKLPWARDMPLTAFQQGQREGLSRAIVRYLASRNAVMREHLNTVVGDPQLHAVTGQQLFNKAVEIFTSPVPDITDVLTRSDAAMIVNGIPLDQQSDMRQQYLNQPEIRAVAESLNDYNSITVSYTREQVEAGVKWCYDHLNAPNHAQLVAWAATMGIDMSGTVPHQAITDHWDDDMVVAAGKHYIPMVVQVYRDAVNDYQRTAQTVHKQTWVCDRLNWPYKPIGIWRNAGSCCRRHILCPNYSDYRVDPTAVLNFTGTQSKQLPNAVIITPLSTEVSDLRTMYVAYNH